jgi:hypothetical protein
MNESRTDGTGHPAGASGSFPHVLPARRRPPADFDDLNFACRLQAVAWSDFCTLVGTLELVGELLTGDDGPEWTIETLTRWRDALDRDALFDLAEELRCEAATVWATVREGRAQLRRNERGAA